MEHVRADRKDRDRGGAGTGSPLAETMSRFAGPDAHCIDHLPRDAGPHPIATSS